MNESNIPLLAIEVDSCSVRAMATSKTEDDLLYVYGSVSLPLGDGAEGRPKGPQSIALAIRNSMRKLAEELRLKEMWSKGYVCLGGVPIQLMEVTAVRNFLRKQEITTTVLDDLEREAISKIEGDISRGENNGVLGLYPMECIVDGKNNLSPLGTSCRNIQRNFLAFVGKAEFKERVMKCVHQGFLGNIVSFARPDALVMALATEEDKSEGCAIVDMGGQTTTLTLYKDDKFVDTQVFKMGGDDITSAICNFHIPFHGAEKMKKMYGSCMLNQDDFTLRITSDKGKMEITRDELTQVIREKVDAIYLPIIETINNNRSFVSKIYLTSGGSLLKGIVEYLQTKTEIPLDFGSHAPWLCSDALQEQYCKPTYSALIGTSILGFEYEEEHAEQEKLKVLPFVQWIIDFFSPE